MYSVNIITVANLIYDHGDNTWGFLDTRVDRTLAADLLAVAGQSGAGACFRTDLKWSIMPLWPVP